MDVWAKCPKTFGSAYNVWNVQSLSKILVFPAFYVFQMATTRMVWLIEFGNREYLYQDLRIYVFVLTIADETLNFIVNIDQYNKVRLGAGWLFRF